MALSNIVIHLLLVATFGMAFFSAVSALRCYAEYKGDINELECHSSCQRCGIAQCDNEKVFRGCDAGFENNALLVNAFTLVFRGGECRKIFCTGDLCNKHGLEKTVFPKISRNVIPSVEKSTMREKKATTPENDEMPKVKNDENPGPPNGTAAGIVGWRQKPMRRNA